MNNVGPRPPAASLSNGLTERHTKLRLITRMAYGFSSTDNIIALCLLDRDGYCPSLPGRALTE
jgi:hypothetical protein